jgi:hypothetical protein
VAHDLKGGRSIKKFKIFLLRSETTVILFLRIFFDGGGPCVPLCSPWDRREEKRR